MEKDSIILDIKLFLQLIFQIKSPAHKQNQAREKIRQQKKSQQNLMNNENYLKYSCENKCQQTYYISKFAECS